MGRLRLAGDLSVGQHADPVADLQHLIQLVADEDHALPLLGHVADDAEQRLALLGQQHGGRLVQDQDIRAGIQHLQDLDLLLHTDAQLLHGAVQIQLNAVAGLQLVQRGADLLAVQPGKGAVAADEPYVFHGVQPVYQHEMLVYHADPVAQGLLGRGDANLLSVDKDLARVRPVDAVDHVHQRGLSRAVFAQQCQNLTGI